MSYRKMIDDLKREEKGSFTIEATMLFPILLILVLCFIFFSLVIYEKVTSQYQANAIASAMAYSWNNSSADVSTGEFGMTEHTTMNGDGLYWRLTGNNFLDKFGLGGIVPGNDLVSAKTSRINGYDATIEFHNNFLIPEVEVKISRSLALPASVANIFGISEIEAVASHPISEPAEVIRTTDFAIYGTEKLMEYAQHIQKFISKGK